MTDQPDTTIDTSGLDPAAVLAALYNGSRPQGMGFIQYDPTPMTIAQARALLTNTTYFDYLHGRVMKVCIEGDTLDPWGYDRDNGAGVAATIISELRSNDGSPIGNMTLGIHESGREKAAVAAAEASGMPTYVEKHGPLATVRLGFDETGQVADLVRPYLPTSAESSKD